jgi:hypothetical protein
MKCWKVEIVGKPKRKRFIYSKGFFQYSTTPILHFSGIPLFTISRGNDLARVLTVTR